ncbi:MULTISPECIES: hotdog family protein [Paraburkholderia]|jgi:predicted hotdog family 3-hydroxylacyl-ACP dehydratase|uniref:Predicted 3-hydroxylacyl-ACP dehydratase, HotDog domain n=1 Tax=Paraburkholderia phenazinium TaxID=60549 RepID=A0A1N6KQM6_9BURK|nr:hotdog family protein [Paraburkholderia phenazinium]SIO58824.1 Predicted 3-hydroxylacyl-ACP dehydratase, HotDog domain [Paraburkholderia phenazinium]
MTSSFPLSPPLDHAWIAAHIPHSGSMCLLDQVVEWDAEHIRCTATSHRDPHNPLRAQGRLAAVCGIEYAAQAMAVHGALLGASQDRPRAGFLASVRDVEAQVARLDTLGGPLNVEAERLSGNDNNILYRFALRCDERLLLTGRATVMLDASGATLTAARALSPGPHFGSVS